MPPERPFPSPGHRTLWFSAPVLWHPGGYDIGHLTSEMRRMKAAGFNAVRFHNADPVENGPGTHDFRRTDDWLSAASAADIGVVLHPDNALVPGPLTLAAHGLTAASFERAYADDPRWLACVESWLAPIVRHIAPHPSLIAWGANGEDRVGRARLTDPEDHRRFVAWLRNHHPSLEALDKAWNIYPGPEDGRPAPLLVRDWDDAIRILDGFDADPQINGVHYGKLNYGAARDLMRFLADKQVARLRAFTRIFKTLDPAHPVMAGGHLLAANQPAYLWDNAATARAGDAHKTSVHLSWHFDGMAGEIDRPLYVQSRQTRDYAKDSFTSVYETTGGPVQYSGGYGNSMHPGLMRRLCLTYLAAGNLGLGFWTWNARPGGWETGEYGLTTLSGALSPWAREAGRIATALGKHAQELAQARQTHPVALLEDWDTQAILSLEPGRVDLPTTRDGTGTAQQANRALNGAARALLDAHIPFEILVTTDLHSRTDLPARWPVLYAPHLRALADDTLDALSRYVAAGGHLIADVQFGFQDSHGKLRPTGPHGAHARLFGAYIDAIHDARTGGKTYNGVPLPGFYGDLIPTTAHTLATYSDGTPAITRTTHGRGTATLIGFDAARLCHRPGQPEIQRLIARLAQFSPPGWDCDAPLAYRLRAPGVDHYFLLNDGPARTALLRVADQAYTAHEDVLAGSLIPASGPSTPVALPAEGALWLRCPHA
jgi:beta-galactosidase